MKLYNFTSYDCIVKGFSQTNCSDCCAYDSFVLMFRTLCILLFQNWNWHTHGCANYISIWSAKPSTLYLLDDAIIIIIERRFNLTIVRFIFTSDSLSPSLSLCAVISISFSIFRTFIFTLFRPDCVTYGDNVSPRYDLLFPSSSSSLKMVIMNYESIDILVFTSYPLTVCYAPYTMCNVNDR